MARKMIVRVTVTGADDSIRPEQLIPIAEEFPFVEFGILLSKKQQGSTRFPSRRWLEELYDLSSSRNQLFLSGHICGSWLRDMCLGEQIFFSELDPVWKMFQRFQLNFHGESQTIDIWKFGRLLENKFSGRQVIFQVDKTENDEIFRSVRGLFDVDACPLIDSSSGCGKLPKEWPVQIDVYCGYAGGLSPENLHGELEKIAKVVNSRIWIDAETWLRSEDDRVFALSKVRSFLVVAEPWMI